MPDSRAGCAHHVIPHHFLRKSGTGLAGLSADAVCTKPQRGRTQRPRWPDSALSRLQHVVHARFCGAMSRELLTNSTLASSVVVGETQQPSPRAVTDAVSYGGLLGGLAWTAASKWSAQVFSWGSTVIVVRLLSPQDFGVVGMATVFLGLLTVL